MQSFKVKDAAAEEQVCSLVGRAAKRAGAKRNWHRHQTLWWRGTAYARRGRSYQELLDRAFWALFTQNESARRALLATGGAALTHSCGKRKPSETVLTRAEFTGRLVRIRDALASAGS